MKEFLSAHVRATTERAREEPVVLAVQDTASLNYTGLAAVCEGLGRVGTDESGALGLIVHDTVAFTPAGLPLGVLDAQVWARDTKEKEKSAAPIREKESCKWLASYERACVLQTECGKRTMVVSVGDREADFYELFCKPVIARTAHSCWCEPARTAVCARSAGICSITCTGSRLAGSTSSALRLVTTAGHVRPRSRYALRSWSWRRHRQEQSRPRRALRGAGPRRSSTRWGSAARVAVADHGDGAGLRAGQKVLSWYTVRWAIEVFHRTLKSGCRIEDRQLENAHRLENCLAIDMVVAWRILHLRHLSRVDPDAPCTVYFTQDDYEALYAVTHPDKPLPKKAISIRDATRLVAMLGGFLARKSDGEPGAETLWRGLQRLDGICLGWRAARRALQRGP